MLLSLVQQFEPALFEARVAKGDRQRRRGRDAHNSRAESLVAVYAESLSVPGVSEAQERFGCRVGNSGP